MGCFNSQPEGAAGDQYKDKGKETAPAAAGAAAKPAAGAAGAAAPAAAPAKAQEPAAPARKKYASRKEEIKEGYAFLLPQGKNRLKDEKDLWEIYSNQKLLGEGAFGKVFLVIEKKTKQQFALKQLKKSDPEMGMSADQMMEMFVDEAAMLKRLEHKNIVGFHACYETPKHYVVITQFLKGGELFDRLMDMKNFSERSCCIMAKQMIQALAYCHKQDIAHRDLKPENYVFETNEMDSPLRLIDFGCAKLVWDTDMFDDLAGTPYYIAPEICRARPGQKFSPKKNFSGKELKSSDMWSVGVIIMILMSGTPPFNGNDNDQIMDAVQRGAYRWPASAKPSPQLQDFVSKLLVIDTDKRMNAIDALAHPWIAVPDKNSDEALGPTFMSALNEFNQQNQIKKAVAKLMSNNMTPAATEKLNKLFQSLDVDGDGVLDVGEIATYMKKLYPSKSQAECMELAKQFMKGVDEDGSGKINIEEFSTAHVQGKLSHDEKAVRMAFDAVDTDGSGKLDGKEMAILLGMPESSVDAIIKECDTDGDGQISFDEFWAAMQTKGPRGRGPSQAAGAGAAGPKPSPVAAKMPAGPAARPASAAAGNRL